MKLRTIERTEAGLVAHYDLGTRIEKAVQPVAKAIDKIAGTKIVGCGGCKKMRDRLNSGMTISEASTIRAIEFIGRKLAKRKQTIFAKVDARLKADGK